MRVSVYTIKESRVTKSNEQIILKRRLFCLIDRNYIWERFYPIRVHSVNRKRVYMIKNPLKKYGHYISLTFLQHQRFLFIQRKHWLQQENNIRYIINIIFLLAGLYLTIIKN